MRSLGIILGIFLFIFLVCPTSSQALTILGDETISTTGLGDFEGEFTYSFSGETSATLSVELTNTTPLPAAEAYIAGFVFNNPGSITGVSFSDTYFQLLGATSFNNNVSGSPFGDFDIGAALGGDFLGGGSPNNGIPIGSTKTFSFGLTGTGLHLLTEQSFVNELSYFDNGGPRQFFLVRIKGIKDVAGLDLGEGSDKVPATTDGNGVIPEPATMILLGSGLLGLAFFGRGKGKKA